MWENEKKINYNLLLRSINCLKEAKVNKGSGNSLKNILSNPVIIALSFTSIFSNSFTSPLYLYYLFYFIFYYYFFIYSIIQLLLFFIILSIYFIYYLYINYILNLFNLIN